MSTFYGGEQLTNVYNFNTNNSSAGVIYTVPSGKYAVVKVKFVSSGSLVRAIYNIGAIGDNRYVDQTNAGVPHTSTSNNDVVFTLSVGQYLNCDNLGGDYSIDVYEYTNP